MQAEKRFVLAVLPLPLTLCFSDAQAQGVFEHNVIRRAPDKFVADELLVKFRPGTDAQLINQINQKHGGRLVRRSSHGVHRLRFQPGQAPDKIPNFQAENAVEFVEPNYIYTAFFEPNDPLREIQWNLDAIQMEKAWDIQRGEDTVIVAVVDTGVAYEDFGGFRKAPDLANTAFVKGFDFVENDERPNDDNGHGTHIAGTIAQSTNNAIGVAGIAFNTAIMPVKVMDRVGDGTNADIADGIIWAVDNGAKVINLSLGGSRFSRTIEEAVAYAYDNGVTVVASSGNENASRVSYPAAYDDYVIAVGATRFDGTRAPYSNFGASIDLVAPGGDISADQNGDGFGDGILQNTFNPGTLAPGDFGYWFFQGTSMAAPHVAAAAALLIAAGIRHPDDIRDILQTTAQDKGPAGWDEEYGHGLIDVHAALNAVTSEARAVQPAGKLLTTWGALKAQSK
jgi:serine protease